MLRVVVEGASDEGAARSIVRGEGISVFEVIVKKGKGDLDPSLAAYNRAAAREPWLIFRDADTDCPVTLRSALLPAQAPRLSFRIAQSMTEAWLMADVQSFSTYFRVSAAKVPPAPENLPHAKRALLSLCMKSKSRSVREGMVHANGHRPGPLYTSTLNAYALDHWRPKVAAGSAPSLARALAEIRSMLSSGRW